MGKEFTVEQMKELMACIRQNEIGEFLYESEGIRLRIRGKHEQMGLSGAAPLLQGAQADLSAGVSIEEQAAADSVCTEKSSQEQNGRFLTSPIVGTFYAASAPDKPPFAQVGQLLQQGEVAFIVESMKVMNEVTADQSGVVAEILVENGDPVEYGQPIVRLQ